MSYPQDPYGPQDPYQPYQEPTPPTPPWPADPTAPPPPPMMPPPPISGAQYPPPPVSGAPYQPTSGSPYQPQQPGAYPPPPGPDQGYQPGSFSAPPAPDPGYQQQYPNPGYQQQYQPGAPGAPYVPGAAPGAPGYPFGPVQPPKSNKKPIIIIAVVVVVLALLCCVGGIVALVMGSNEVAKEAERQLPGPVATTAPGSRPTAQPTSSSSSPTGENFNLKPGETLTVTDALGTMEITVQRFRTSIKGCKSYSPEPKKGLYVIADITATVTKGTMSINPFYFQWVADDGSTTSGIAGAFAGCGDLLNSGVHLEEGSKRTGSVTVDVADQNGALEYRHKFETVGSWKP
ncbi:hypothetical protein [Micromonospora sp. RTGN7]|uniref:hypothetical protein n=1 Tax=Micromonospora sp. RTGN7 TaxID=3016526 RepID=UPI0029FF55DC|nr:hypothetical protein [Micromonospora sp. RTGN7]